jgi:hypothetical protein
LKLKRKFDCYENTIIPKRKLEGKRKMSTLFYYKNSTTRMKRKCEGKSNKHFITKKNTTTKKEERGNEKGKMK